MFIIDKNDLLSIKHLLLWFVVLCGNKCKFVSVTFLHNLCKTATGCCVRTHCACVPVGPSAPCAARGCHQAKLPYVSWLVWVCRCVPFTQGPLRGSTNPAHQPCPSGASCQTTFGPTLMHTVPRRVRGQLIFRGSAAAIWAVICHIASICGRNRGKERSGCSVPCRAVFTCRQWLRLKSVFICVCMVWRIETGDCNDSLEVLFLLLPTSVPPSPPLHHPSFPWVVSRLFSPIIQSGTITAVTFPNLTFSAGDRSLPVAICLPLFLLSLSLFPLLASHSLASSLPVPHPPRFLSPFLLLSFLSFFYYLIHMHGRPSLPSSAMICHSFFL